MSIISNQLDDAVTARLRSERRARARQFYIWSIEHDAWWCPNRCGYTRELDLAGIYTEAEAREIIRRANGVEYRPPHGMQFNECMIPVECLARKEDHRAEGNREV